MTAARVVPLCRREHAGRDHCDKCGWQRDEGRPAARLREPTSRERRDAAVEALVEIAREQRGVILDLADLLGFYMAAFDRQAPAGRALERCTDELVLFDARCKAGDVDGAVLALRSWIARIGT